MLATRFAQKDVENAVTKGLDRKLVKVVALKHLPYYFSIIFLRYF